MRRSWLAVLAVVPLQLYAQPAPPEHGHGGGPRMQVFIAPSGKPFRAPQGEPYPLATWFAAADRNHDGSIDMVEFRADFLAFFAELDIDHDGRIGPEEIIRYEREVAPEVQIGTGGFEGGFGGGMGGFRGGGGRHGGMGGGRSRGGSGDPDGDGEGMGGGAPRRMEDMPRGGGMFGLINSPEPIAAMDADLSGSVTRAEVLAAADRRFHMLDPDGKGALTLAMLPKVPAQTMRGKMHRGKRP